MASRSRLFRRLIQCSALLLLAVGSAACIGDKNPQDTLSPRGPAAADAKALFYPAFWIAVVVFFLVEGALVYFVVRFRHRRGVDRLPRQVHGNTRAEIAWTIAPTLLLGLLSIPTVATIYHLAPSRYSDSNPINVSVIGHQWWWEFDYTDLGVTTANELHIPTGRAIVLTLGSVDVIHAFFVPQLAGQIDAVPGHQNQLFIQADKAGTYLGQCTQFCGASHAFMRFRVMADTPDDFTGWLNGQKQGPVAPTSSTQAGAQDFANGACIGCHTIQTVSTGKVGPNLTHFGTRTTLAGATLDNTPDNVAKWIRDPQAVKPSAKMPNLHLSEQEITDLVAYLESLK